MTFKNTPNGVFFFCAPRYGLRRGYILTASKLYLLRKLYFGLRQSYILAVAKTKVFIRLYFDNNVKGTVK